jgi:hypothetical protein
MGVATIGSALTLYRICSSWLPDLTKKTTMPRGIDLSKFRGDSDSDEDALPPPKVSDASSLPACSYLGTDISLSALNRSRSF